MAQIRLNFTITPEDIRATNRALRTVSVTDSIYVTDQGLARKVRAVAKVISNKLRAIASKAFQRVTNQVLTEIERNIKMATLLPIVNENPNIRITDERIKNLQRKLNNVEKLALERLLRRAEAGEITEKQLRNWFSRYENVARASDAQNDREEVIARFGEGNTFAFRLLDENAVHCPQCILYATMGVALAKTLPNPTERCECNLSCKCTIFFGNLTQMVRQRKRARSARTGINQ